jgi:hypothetical protein
MSHIILLSAAWYEKVKSGRKGGYHDGRDEKYFMEKWLKSLMEVVAEVEYDNRYDCINYNMNKIMN